jgi:hypothetical protein
MAVKAINDIAGPNGLIPTLLVFGSYPRITITDPIYTTIQERSKAIKNAIKSVAELYVKQQISDALNQRNRPNVEEKLDMAIRDKVLV